MKPFTIRKAAQPSRGANRQSMNADTTALSASGKYATAPGDNRQDDGHVAVAAASQGADAVDDDFMGEETNLTREELDALKPKGVNVVNPWIYKQTHVESLPQQRVSQILC